MAKQRYRIQRTEAAGVRCLAVAGELVSIRSAVGPDRFGLVAGPATERLLDLTGTRPFFAGK